MSPDRSNHSPPSLRIEPQRGLRSLHSCPVHGLPTMPPSARAPGSGCLPTCTCPPATRSLQAVASAGTAPQHVCSPLSSHLRATKEGPPRAEVSCHTARAHPVQHAPTRSASGSESELVYLDRSNLPSALEDGVPWASASSVCSLCVPSTKHTAGIRAAS